MDSSLSQSAERQAVQQQITKVKTDAGRVRAMTTTATLDDDDYASTYWQQLRLVTYRMFQDYWRDPTYLYSKLALCVGAVGPFSRLDIHSSLIIRAKF